MTASVSGTVHAQSDPREFLLDSFIKELNRVNTPYVVMNNYEMLPKVIPSDIDISVPTEFFSKLDRFILRFAELSGTLLVQKLWHGNQKCAYILGAHAHGFLQLDFFVAFSTKFAPSLLSHEELVAGARSYKSFRVPQPDVELLFTVMRRLFKDDWSKRHCARIAELRARITSQDLLPKPYEWLRETVECAIAGDVAGAAERRPDDWRQLRKTARIVAGPKGLLINAIIQSRRIIHRLREETGIVVTINGAANPINVASLEELEAVFHRHLWIDNRYVQNVGWFAWVSLPFKIALLKRRKGLVILQLDSGADGEAWRIRNIARWLAWSGQIDMTLDSPGLSRAEMIDSIVLSQARKTMHAIERGGTQTSGQ